MPLEKLQALLGGRGALTAELHDRLLRLIIADSGCRTAVRGAQRGADRGGGQKISPVHKRYAITLEVGRAGSQLEVEHLPIHLAGLSASGKVPLCLLTFIRLSEQIAHRTTVPVIAGGFGVKPLRPATPPHPILPPFLPPPSTCLPQ